MKNKEFRILMAAAALTGTLIVGLIGEAGPVSAKDKNTTVEKTAVTNSDSKTINAKPYKSETVYAMIDPNGEVKNVTVSDQLKNISDVIELRDKSDLEHIENVKGDETFTSKDGNLIWSTNNEDICYQGTSTKTLPVGVKVTYMLDGKEVGADDLKGQSGHLVIRCTYENHTVDNGGTAVPFLMATGIVLDNDIFKNVTVTNGRLISDGEKELAVGCGIPSLQEMLGTDKLKIPDYFEVEADVTDYEPAEAVTIATNSLFNELDTDGFDSLSELQDSMNQLQNASSQLVNGSGELRSGLDVLLSSSGTLTDGISQLANGSNSLADGTEALKNGADGLSAGPHTVSSKVSDELLPGIQALDTGVTQMQSSLAKGLPALADGMNVLDAGIRQAADGTAALNNGISQIGAGTKSLNENVKELGTAISSLNSMINPKQTADISGQAADLSTNAANLAGGLYAAADQAGVVTYSAGAGTDSYDEIAILQSLLDSGMIADDAAAASISGVIQSLSNEQWTRDNAGDVVVDNSSLKSTLTQLAGQADALAGAAGTIAANSADSSNAALMQQLQAAVGELNGKVNGANGLVDSVAALDAALNPGDGTNPSIVSAAGQLNAAMNSGNAEAGIASIRDGASELNQAINGENGLSGQITMGVSRLKDGTSKLAAGVDGENGLAAGLNRLNTGADQLADGSGTVHSGTDTLALGIRRLQTGSGALIDGVRKLDDGAGQLNDGIIQFDQDGIQKLVNAFDGDIDELLLRANGILNNSKAYKNFSGIADDMDGEVKFVFVTE